MSLFEEFVCNVIAGWTCCTKDKDKFALLFHDKYVEILLYYGVCQILILLSVMNCPTRIAQNLIKKCESLPAKFAFKQGIKARRQNIIDSKFLWLQQEITIQTQDKKTNSFLNMPLQSEENNTLLSKKHSSIYKRKRFATLESEYQSKPKKSLFGVVKQDI